ncbi:MAG: hypothetical protein HN443_07360 [Flavobacteriaceae bacterium]|nr:hypothetical protein [Flavobacteriaceae bacterium]
MANSREEIQQLLALQSNAYLLTNTQILDSLENWDLISQRKSVFEDHTTKIYQKSD